MIISVAIQKGGTGKTTTAFNLSAALAKMDHKVLLVSLDAQKNLNDYVGYVSDNEPDIFDLICALVNGKNVPVKESIRYLSKEGIYYIPSSSMLRTVVSMLGASDAAIMRSDMILKNLFSHPEFEQFDYIILDCSPSLDLFVSNALNASDGVIIPALAEIFGIQGILPIMTVIENVQQTTNPNLRITGILPTMVDRRTNSGKELRDFISTKYEKYAFETYMPRLPSQASESIARQESLVRLKTELGEKYMMLAEEVINRMNDRGE